MVTISILSSKTDIDDCASDPCKNNGTCTDRVNGFDCSCAPGVNGSQCETGNNNQIHFSSGALSMSLAVLLFSRAVLQESEAKLEMKKIYPSSILCGGLLP